MKREEVLKSPEYWTAKTQVELYNLAEKFMADTGRNKSQLAEYLGVSKGYVSQLLNGDYDHRMSKFFELALAFGMVPQIDFVPVEDYVKEDKCLSEKYDNQPFIFSTTSSSAGSHFTEPSSPGVSHLAASCSRRVRLPLFTLQI